MSAVARDAFPDCFASLDGWRQWRALALDSGAADVVPCTNCPPAYEAQMRRAGRCDRARVARVFVVNARGVPA